MLKKCGVVIESQKRENKKKGMSFWFDLSLKKEKKLRNKD
jgi:hypothetical protein